MSDPFLGEIRIVAFNFAPRGWALCSGQLLPIGQNQNLFALLGTTYGGDGRVNFGLPDFRGAVPVGEGSGPNLTHRDLGERGGADMVTLAPAELPAHTHPARASTAPAGSASPVNRYLAASGVANFGTATGPTGLFGPALSSTGQSGQHENRQPYLALSFVIALFGIFPSRD